MSSSNYGTTPITSTPCSSMGNASGVSSTNNLHDIKYLLYLETMRRVKEDESNIRRQMEEKLRQHEDVKNEYTYLYNNFAEIYKLATNYQVLDMENCLDKLKLEEAERNTQNIVSKINPDKRLEVLDVEALRECKEKLKNCQKYENVKYQCKKIAEQKECVDVIKAVSVYLESAIECATLQSIDHFVEKLQFREKQ